MLQFVFSDNETTTWRTSLTHCPCSALTMPLGGTDRLKGGRPRIKLARRIERSTISNIIPYVFFKYLAVVIYNIIEEYHSCGTENLDLLEFMLISIEH